MSDPAFDVMTPVELESGKTAWLKIGVAWPDDRGKYAMRISLASMPFGAFGKPSIELYLYPVKPKGKGRALRVSRGEQYERQIEDHGDFEVLDFESPGGDDPRGGI